MVKTPVLFITFVRPEYARPAWEAIKAAQPKTLYFYSNKGREEKTGEVDKNNEIRAYINEINWECDLHTWFRDSCVDVYTSLWGAIDWLFDNEERGIVLEEDVVASMAFFSYCDKMLSLLEFEERVWMISGNNYHPELSPQEYDFFYSKYLSIFGWASWKDRWQRLDRTLSFWPYLKKSKQFWTYWSPNIHALIRYHYWNQNYKLLHKRSAWDGIFYCNMLKNNGLIAIPRINLSADIGIVGSHNKCNENNSFSLLDFSIVEYSIESIPKNVKEFKYFEIFYFLKEEVLKRLRRKFNVVINNMVK